MKSALYSFASARVSLMDSGVSFGVPRISESLLETTFPGGEKAKMPRLPFLVGDYDFNKRLDPPSEVGQDTREILESAGFTKEQIDEYVANNIIRTGN